MRLPEPPRRSPKSAVPKSALAAAKDASGPGPPAAPCPPCRSASPSWSPPGSTSTPWSIPGTFSNAVCPHGPHGWAWCAKPRTPWQSSRATIKSPASRPRSRGSHLEVGRHPGDPALVQVRAALNTTVEYTTGGAKDRETYHKSSTYRSCPAIDRVPKRGGLMGSVRSV